IVLGTGRSRDREMRCPVRQLPSSSHRGAVRLDEAGTAREPVESRCAGVAQLVEQDLPKVQVARSSRVSRSGKLFVRSTRNASRLIVFLLPVGPPIATATLLIASLF